MPSEFYEVVAPNCCLSRRSDFGRTSPNSDRRTAPCHLRLERRLGELPRRCPDGHGHSPQGAMLACRIHRSSELFLT
jgi:hypothetical protein